jgi:hypothetical protein
MIYFSSLETNSLDYYIEPTPNKLMRYNISIDNKYLLIPDANNRAKIWDIDTSKEIFSFEAQQPQ